jgi:hypothetical protein
MWLMAKCAILSCSTDRVLNLRSLYLAAFDHTKITVNLPNLEEKITCIEVLDNKCMPTSLDCFIGTNFGNLYFLNRKWVTQGLELILESKNEGPVNQLVSAFGLVVWSTKSYVRAIHFRYNRQKLC